MIEACGMYRAFSVHAYMGCPLDLPMTWDQLITDTSNPRNLRTLDGIGRFKKKHCILTDCSPKPERLVLRIDELEPRT